MTFVGSYTRTLAYFHHIINSKVINLARHQVYAARPPTTVRSLLEAGQSLREPLFEVVGLKKRKEFMV